MTLYADGPRVYSDTEITDTIALLLQDARIRGAAAAFSTDGRLAKTRDAIRLAALQADAAGIISQLVREKAEAQR